MNKNNSERFIELTFTQCKQIIANGVDLREFVAKVHNQPYFIEHMGTIDSISELQAILQGGCESGAYMPAVTYSTAMEAMNEHSTDIELWASDLITTIEFNPAEDTVRVLAARLCSAAVESWCMQFADALDGVDWD